jgi:hypothetical protein
MHGLRRLQFAFAEAVFKPSNARVAQRIRANGLDPVRRAQLYHNNMFVGLTGALEAVYPVVQRLVGDQFFHFAAKEYIQDRPSQSGNLHGFGDRFADFLAVLPSAAGLPYLADVARLEWAYHEVFHAAIGPRLDVEGLQGLSASSWERLGFELHPASRLIESDYPVLQIWQVNRDDYTGDQRVDLARDGERLMVLRRDLEIAMYRLSPGEFAWLRALINKQDISRAYEQACLAEPEFDLDTCLKRHVARGTLVDWYLVDGEQRPIQGSARSSCGSSSSSGGRSHLRRSQTTNSFSVP